MDPINEIARAQTAELVDEDGDAIELDLERGLSDAGVDAFEEELGVALPGELRDLLAYATGFSGVLDSVDFTGRGYDVELAEIFPSGLPIAGDGFGNFWVADLTPQPRDVVAVFFACHDPAVILLQSPSIGHFLHEVFRTYVPPHASLVNDVQRRPPVRCVAREPRRARARRRAHRR
jgi:cell wall assembly regulator SMI1